MSIREKLAKLEHRQWVHWTKYMLNNLTDENISRWKWQCVTPYEQLSEKEKESDREWADKALEVVALHMAGFQSSNTSARDEK